MAKLMGYDFQKIRLLAHHARFPGAFRDFDPAKFLVTLNGVRTENGLDALPIVHRFIPSPGWKGHIELE